MKKLISMCLAVIMSCGILVTPTLAATKNDVTRIRKVMDEAEFDTTLVFEDFHETSKQLIELTLTNAEWREDDFGSEFIDKTNSKVWVEFTPVDGEYTLNLPLIADGEGKATVKVRAIDSEVTEGTYTVAEIVDSETAVTVEEKVALQEGSTAIDTIIIEELVPGAIKEDAVLTLRLDKDFEWTTGANFTIDIAPDYCGLSVLESEVEIDDRDLIIPLVGSTKAAPAAIFIEGLEVYFDADDVDFGTTCEFTVTGGGFTKQTVAVGTTTDYEVTVEVEDEDLPTFISGRLDNTKTLELTIKETIANSWVNGKRTEVIFPVGVEVVKVNHKIKNGTVDIDIDENEVDLSIVAEKDKKLSLTMTFELSISPEFTGDIVATLSGRALDGKYEATVGKAIFPIEVKAEKNIYNVDYRNSEASDIIITEAEAGMLEKGDMIHFELEGVHFEDEPEIEIIDGDIEFYDPAVKDGILTLEVKSESRKEAAVIKVTDIKIYMDRLLPLGEYDLLITTTKNDEVENINEIKDVKNAIIKNFSEDKDVTGLFTCDEIVAVEDYIVRTTEDATFTDKVIVTIGSDKMISGSKEIALDAPAYISGGRTMLPVRAITEALSDNAVITWNDATRTVTILFGNRVISMTIGSNVMYINGVALAMTAAPEITNDRTFLPLRDLAYALGLNDSKIDWNDITKTVTLN